MDVLRETTKWPSSTTANNTYLVDGTKLIAYIIEGTTEPVYMKNPLRFDKKHRTFETLKTNPFKAQKETRIKVEGSKGAVYWVNPEEKSCSCSGFKFRGKCRHVEQYCNG